MLKLKSSPVRIGLAVTILASLAAYAAACGGSADDTFVDVDAGSTDATTGADAGGRSDASDAGHTGTDATASDSSYCGLVESRAAACDSGVVNDAKCHKQEACFDAVIRPAANAAYKGCVAGRACGVSDDSCVVEAGLAFLDAGPYDAYQTNCLAKSTTCISQDSGFADDNCSALQAALVNDAIFGRLQGCIMQTCPAVGACLGGIFVEAGCN